MTLASVSSSSLPSLAIFCFEFLAKASLSSSESSWGYSSLHYQSLLMCRRLAAFVPSFVAEGWSE